MSLYMKLLFGLLTVEMVTLAVLVLPLPLKIRKELLKVYESVFNSKEFLVVIGMMEFLVGLLLMDSIQRVFKLQKGDTFEPFQNSYIQSPEHAAKTFYNQRNIYISGAVIYVSIAIFTVFQIIKKLIKYQILQENQNDSDLDGKLAALEKALASKDKELLALKKQKKGLERSYDELCDKANAIEEIADKKND